MTYFSPKKYQQDPANGGGVLDSVEAYFKACHQHGRAALAFTAVTEALWGRGLPYHPLSDFAPDMPYFCLRVPHSVVLWLVPSKTIRDPDGARPERPPAPAECGLARSGAGDDG